MVGGVGACLKSTRSRKPACTLTNVCWLVLINGHGWNDMCHACFDRHNYEHYFISRLPTPLAIRISIGSWVQSCRLTGRMEDKQKVSVQIHLHEQSKQQLLVDSPTLEESNAAMNVAQNQPSSKNPDKLVKSGNWKWSLPLTCSVRIVFKALFYVTILLAALFLDENQTGCANTLPGGCALATEILNLITSQDKLTK